MGYNEENNYNNANSIQYIIWFFLGGGGGIRLFLGQPQSHTDHIPIVFDRHPYYLSSYSWITNNLYEFKENGQKMKFLPYEPF